MPDPSCTRSYRPRISFRVTQSKLQIRTTARDSAPAFYKDDAVIFTIPSSSLNLDRKEWIDGPYASIIANTGEKNPIRIEERSGNYIFEYKFEYPGWKKITFNGTVAKFVTQVDYDAEDMDIRIDGSPTSEEVAGTRTRICIELWVYITQDIMQLTSLIEQLEGNNSRLLDTHAEVLKLKEERLSERLSTLRAAPRIVGTERPGGITVVPASERQTRYTIREAELSRNIQREEDAIVAIEKKIQRQFVPDIDEYKKMMKPYPGLIFLHDSEILNIPIDNLPLDEKYALSQWLRKVVTTLPTLDLVQTSMIDAQYRHHFLYDHEFDVAERLVQVTIYPNKIHPRHFGNLAKELRLGSRIITIRRTKSPSGAYKEYIFHPDDIIKVRFNFLSETVVIFAKDLQRASDEAEFKKWVEITSTVAIEGLLLIGGGPAGKLFKLASKKAAATIARGLARKTASMGGRGSLTMRTTVITRISKNTAIALRSRRTMQGRVRVLGRTIVIRYRVRILIRHLSIRNVGEAEIFYQRIYEKFLTNALNIFTDGLVAGLKKLWKSYLDSLGQSYDKPFAEYLEINKTNNSLQQQVIVAVMEKWLSSFSSSVSSYVSGLFLNKLDSFLNNTLSGNRVLRFYKKALEEPGALITERALRELNPASRPDFSSPEEKSKQEEVALKTIRDLGLEGIEMDDKLSKWFTDMLIENHVKPPEGDNTDQSKP